MRACRVPTSTLSHGTDPYRLQDLKGFNIKGYRLAIRGQY